MAKPLVRDFPRKLIPVSEPNLCGNEKAYVNDCLESGWISSNGIYVNRFEESFSRYLSSPHAIAVANGTCALHLALLALGIGPGDEVIVPSLTYIASANSIIYSGATPVFVDSLPDSWNMDPHQIESAITSKTKAIMAVHLYGNPCDLDALLAITRKHGLYLIEDTAEAFGSRYRNQLLGTFGDISTFSFFGNKTITTGEGGMVVTSRADLAEKIRLFKGQGMSLQRRYFFEVIGYNYRMTNIQAAIGLAQLENAEHFIRAKRRNAELYREFLSGIPGLQFPHEDGKCFDTFWMYSIVLDPSLPFEREELTHYLSSKGIETRPFFIPCHQLPPYRHHQITLPVAEALGTRGLNLPSSTCLTREDILWVSEAIRTFIACRK